MLCNSTTNLYEPQNSKDEPECQGGLIFHIHRSFWASAYMCEVFVKGFSKLNMHTNHLETLTINSDSVVVGHLPIGISAKHSWCSNILSTATAHILASIFYFQKMLIYNKFTIYELVSFLIFLGKVEKCCKLKHCRLFGVKRQGSSPFKCFLLTSLMRLTSFSPCMLVSLHLVDSFLHLPNFLFLTCTFYQWHYLYRNLPTSRVLIKTLS